jgi:hypothetical protein
MAMVVIVVPPREEVIKYYYFNVATIAIRRSAKQLPPLDILAHSC